MVDINKSSANSLPHVEGLRLIGRVNRALAPIWRPEFSGVAKSTGKPFTLKAHAETLIQVSAGDYLIACTLEYPELKAESELHRCVVPKAGEDIDLPIVRIQSIDRNNMVALNCRGTLNPA